MEILLNLLILLVSVIALLLVWLNLPGTFLMAALLFAAVFVSEDVFNLQQAFIALGGMVLLEGIELGLGGLTARLYGGSPGTARWAIVGGLLGTIIGASLFLIIGAFAGMLAGSWLAVFSYERKLGASISEARMAAFGSLLGNVAAKLMKNAAVVILGIWMARQLTSN